MSENSKSERLDSKSAMSKQESEAAPLEQNVKNMYCDGTPYKVIKEIPSFASLYT